MNKRSIIIAICVIAVTVGSLTFGKTMRLGPLASVQDQDAAKPLPKVPGNRSGATVSLNENKEATVSTTDKAGGPVPDEIVYSYLFRSILLLRERAAEEEKQGRPGSGYTKAIQASLKLDDTAAKALNDAATAWDSKKQEMESKAEALLNKGQIETSSSDAELQLAYEEINNAVLDARDTLRASLGEKGFEALEKSIEENVTSKIDSKPFNPDDPTLVRSNERVSPGKRYYEAPPEAVMDRGRLIVRHEVPKATPADIDGRSKKGKRGTLSSSKQTEAAANAMQGEQPNSLFNFCFFGGVVFYGTFVWLVPSIDRIVQVSFTQLDFCAGLRADPYVYAELFSAFAFTNAESMGRSFVRPAVVELNVLALPSTIYGAFADHWIFHCFEICQWIQIDAYQIFFQTPQCVSGSSSGFAKNFDTCPGPSPSPTPTPTVTIDAVGFNGDLPLRQWHVAHVLRKRIDFPDGTESTWNKAADPKLAVAQKRGSSLSMFATFGVTPATSVSRPAQVRVKRGTDIVATKTNIDIGGGRSVVRNIIVPYNNLESASVVKRADYEFDWEVSFDNGSNWQSVGKSGPHKIYWTWDNPLTDIWRNQVQTTNFPVNDGLEADTLYDEALQRSAGAAEGKGTIDEIVANITKRYASQMIYDPCGGVPADHPLIITAPPHKAQCSSNANLLRGLLRTIGIDAKTQYIWGGSNSTGQINAYQFFIFQNQSLQVKRSAQNEGPNDIQNGTCPNVEADPHFTFHALVEVGGKVYDPSYGLVNQSLTAADTAQAVAIEVSRWPDAGFFLGSAVPSDRVVVRNLPPGFGVNTQTQCDHTLDIPLGPNRIDVPRFFVAQHYLDFLNRVADEDGLNFWEGTITECGANTSCIEHKRVMASLAFFLSIEYQERGYFVHRYYKAGFGRRPLLSEFLTEMGKISPNFQTPQMEIDKTVYGQEFVETEAFRTQYPFEMTFQQYVDTLFANAGVTPDSTTRTNLINGLAAGTENRATVLRKVVDNQAYRDAEFRPAFVEMCYFGYLRRDPDPLGFAFWLQSLNNSNGDLYHATKAFIDSTEYRARFGQP